LEQKKKVYEILDSCGISYQIIEHPAVYTVEDMALLEVFKDNPWIAKNLLDRKSVV
jgi:hypothetical protein